MNKKRLAAIFFSAVMMIMSANSLYAEELTNSTDSNVSLPATIEEALYPEQLSNPTVSVDGKLVGFDDQEPIISENNDTLIPLRGVLEAMGASVEWREEDRSVYVKSHDNITRLLLTIDDPVMIKYTLTSITTVDSEEISLSTAPIIMNDRTMIPLRVVSENMDAQVDWDDATRHITIQTKEYLKYISDNTPVSDDAETPAVYNPKDSLPYLYLEADKTEVNKGDVITVDLKLANSDLIADEWSFSGLSATLFYDSTKLTADSSNMILNDVVADQVLEGSNPDYRNDSVKYVCVVMPNSTNLDKTVNDGTIARFTFTVNTDEAFDISIADRITPIRGSDTYLLLSNSDLESYSLNDYTTLYIDTTPISFNK